MLQDENLIYVFFFTVSMLQLEEPNSCMGRLVNHGVPNSKMKLLKLDGSPVLCLFTIKDIEEGEEILCDYGVKNLPWEQKQVGAISCILNSKINGSRKYLTIE